MSAFDQAWSFLKGENEIRMPNGDYHAHVKDYLDFATNSGETINMAGVGPVAATNYYNAGWHMSHPDPQVSSEAQEMGRDKLQALLDSDLRLRMEDEWDGIELAEWNANPPESHKERYGPRPDPFRMKRPDMLTEIDEMETEMARRRGRKAVDYDHQLDFDTDNPQNNKFMSTTKPQMKNRISELLGEMERRDERKRSR